MLKIAWGNNQKLRYLVVGGWNTFFGYFMMILLFNLLHSKIHVVIIATISSIISITMSYLTYKKFVFKTSGNWLREWLRCFFVYSTASFFSIIMLWVLVDIVGLNIYIAQLSVMLIVVLASYISHKNFTFKNE